MENDFDLFIYATETAAFYHQCMDLAYARASIGQWQAFLGRKVVRSYQRHIDRDTQFTRHDILSAANMMHAHYARVLEKVAA